MNRKRIIFTSLCVILLVALVGGTFAWFFINEEVTVSYGESIFCEAGNSLEITLGDGVENANWSGSIDYRPPINSEGRGNYTTVDISGNGATLYRPLKIDDLQQPVDETFVEATSSLDVATGEPFDYVEMVVTFRSMVSVNVYLGGESFISPVDISVPENPNDPRNNIYGKFSRDYIAGAMRVAVVDYETDELLMLWAPNSQYELIRNVNSATGEYNGTYDFKANSTAAQDYHFFALNEEGEYVEQEVPAEYYATKKFVVDSTEADELMANRAPILAALETEGGKYVTKTVRIRIWFEGTDREAHQALAGGNVKVQLKFIGIPKDKKATNEVNEAAIAALAVNQDSGVISGMQTGMIYTMDGKTWYTYTAGSTVMPVLQKGQSIFVKYAETAAEFESTCAVLTMN